MKNIALLQRGDIFLCGLLQSDGQTRSVLTFVFVEQPQMSLFPWLR